MAAVIGAAVVFGLGRFLRIRVGSVAVAIVGIRGIVAAVVGVRIGSVVVAVAGFRSVAAIVGVFVGAVLSGFVGFVLIVHKSSPHKYFH